MFSPLTQKENHVILKAIKGVVSVVLDVMKPTTSAQFCVLASYEMTRLICMRQVGLAFSVSYMGEL